MKDENINTRTYLTILGGALVLMAAATAGTMRNLEASQRTVLIKAETHRKVAMLAEKLKTGGPVPGAGTALDAGLAMASIERVAEKMGCIDSIESIRPCLGMDESGMLELELTSPDAGKALKFLQAVEKEIKVRTRGISLKRLDLNGKPSLMCIARLSR